MKVVHVSPRRILAVSIVFFLVSACSNSDQSSQTVLTSTTIDPTSSISAEVDQFVRSYLDQAIATRPKLTQKISSADLQACASNAIQQISRSAATSIKKKSDEDESSWIARSRTASLQSAQSGIEAVIASCSK